MQPKFYSLLLLFFSILIANGQETDPEIFYFHTNIDNVSSLKIKENRNGTIEVKSRNRKENAIFEKYTIYKFQLAFPNTKSDLIKTVHTIATDDVGLLSELRHNFPKKYTRIDQFYTTDNAYYPNDYGETHPTKNSGLDYPSQDLDIVMAPEAWAITKGDKKVVVGISDTKIDSLHPDLKGRVSNYLHYRNSEKGQACAHGGNVAGIAIGRMDNNFGKAGICSGCDVIATNYGGMAQLEELVAAGAKVINASWAMCKMGGKYSENIDARISEWYDDGIIIVAGAGNGTDCNRDKIAVGDSLYPASFKRVISVSGVFVQHNFSTDNIFPDKEGNLMTNTLKDRRDGHFFLEKDGSLGQFEVQKGMQVNKAIDLMSPCQSLLITNEQCELEASYGGATSMAAPYVTGTIGLMWSANYCLSSYEIETILKLTTEEIENLPGNTNYKGLMGAGRLNTYRAVAMSKKMATENSNIIVQNRDFYRFDFNLTSAPNIITIKNQTFRDEATVNFKAKNGIVLKPGTHLKPNKDGVIALKSDPSITLKPCEVQPVKDYGPWKEATYEK